MTMVRRSHALAAPVLHFGLGEEIQRLRVEAAAETDGRGRNALTLMKDGPLRVVLILLPAGASMDDHAAPGPATVRVLAGRVRVGAQTAECTCGAGGSVVFNGGIAHSGDGGGGEHSAAHARRSHASLATLRKRHRGRAGSF
jgi:quercetin dioxygenase-like cupin family protein